MLAVLVFISTHGSIRDLIQGFPELKAVKWPRFIKMVSPQGFSKAEGISEVPPGCKKTNRNENPTEKHKNTPKHYTIARANLCVINAEKGENGVPLW